MKRYLVPIVAISAVILATQMSCQQTASEDYVVSSPTTPEIELRKGQGIPFTGHENHAISLNAANQMTSAFQAENPYKSYGWYFGRDAIERILARDAVVGIRIYGGLDDESDFSPVLAGTMADGRDFLAYGLAKGVVDSTALGLAELAQPCPPFCP